MTVGKDRQGKLVQLYQVEGKDLLYIQKAMNYSNPKQVADDLKEFNIPMRISDEAKTHYTFTKQYDNKTNLTGYKFVADASVIYSEKIDVRNYTRGQFYVDVAQNSAPATKSLNISAEVAFRDAPESWFKINDTLLASLSIIQTDMPTKLGWTIDTLGGEFLRIRLSTSGAGSLSSTAYIFINSVKGSFF